MAKRYFLVCAGLFLLALSYHFGVKSAEGQAAAVQGGMVSSPLDSAAQTEGTSTS